ncbi:MAG: hypothetical protein H6R35_569 [Bacteroidetes bacterium]|nr:hypothetical protein [Bacteroidota bacterium]
MFFSGTYENIVLPLLQPFDQWDHPPRMPEPPFQRADEYIVIFFQSQPDTLVFIPSLLTIAAIRFNSARGTFASCPSSGVSREIV